MRHVREEFKDAELGFQIAPMVDVIFVIMLFFLVLAGNRQVETELKMKLPSTEAPPDQMDAPMEEQVSVDSEGGFAHNDEPVTANELKTNFKLLSQQAKSEGGTPIIVTITAAPDAKWEKVTEVMNAMGFAGISNVTFAIAEEF